MGFIRGCQEGLSSKTDALVMRPSLVCRKKAVICDIVGYVVYDGEKAIAAAHSAQEAWWKAYKRLRREEREKEEKKAGRRRAKR